MILDLTLEDIRHLAHGYDAKADAYARWAANCEPTPEGDERAERYQDISDQLRKQAVRWQTLWDLKTGVIPDLPVELPSGTPTEAMNQ